MSSTEGLRVLPDPEGRNIGPFSLNELLPNDRETIHQTAGHIFRYVTQGRVPNYIRNRRPITFTPARHVYERSLGVDYSAGESGMSVRYNRVLFDLMQQNLSYMDRRTIALIFACTHLVATPLSVMPEVRKKADQSAARFEHGREPVVQAYPWRAASALAIHYSVHEAEDRSRIYQWFDSVRTGVNEYYTGEALALIALADVYGQPIPEGSLDIPPAVRGATLPLSVSEVASIFPSPLPK